MLFNKHLLYRIPSTRKVRVYPLELCASFLSRPPSLNRQDYVQSHLRKFQSLVQAASSRFCLKSFQSISSLNCFPLNESNRNQEICQDSVFVFGSGRPFVPTASNLVHEIDVVTSAHESSPVGVQMSVIPKMQSGNLKVPFFTKPPIATSKRINTPEEEVSKTVKKPKKQDSDKPKSTVAPALTKTKACDQTIGISTTPANSVERLLLEAGVCWANFASFMSNQADAAIILQPLQVAQLKQIVKMNPKGSKVSGTKNELVDRIVAMLKAA